MGFRKRSSKIKKTFVAGALKKCFPKSIAYKNILVIVYQIIVSLPVIVPQPVIHSNNSPSTSNNPSTIPSKPPCYQSNLFSD